MLRASTELSTYSYLHIYLYDSTVCKVHFKRINYACHGFETKEWVYISTTIVEINARYGCANTATITDVDSMTNPNNSFELVPAIKLMRL